MNSTEWNERGWSKHTNPSGEIIRVKTYKRILPLWDNGDTGMIEERYKLAEILGVGKQDILCDLEVTIQCNRYRRNGRLLKRLNHR